MISLEKISELATKVQTSDMNIVREYLQHLFLSYLYKKEGSDKLLFKGGTAIRIVFGGSRYSEDLDFSAHDIGASAIETLLIDTISDIQDEGIASSMDIVDSNETTGGYIFNINLNVLGFETGIKVNIQTKYDINELKPEIRIIQNALFISDYSLVILQPQILVAEKMQALIERAKPRDFFDLYFFLRDNELKDFVQRESAILERIRGVLNKVTDADLERDLKVFLPLNYRGVVKTIKSFIIKNMGL